MRNALVLLYTIAKVFLKGEGTREVLLKKGQGGPFEEGGRALEYWWPSRTIIAPTAR